MKKLSILLVFISISLFSCKKDIIVNDVKTPFQAGPDSSPPKRDSITLTPAM